MASSTLKNSTIVLYSYWRSSCSWRVRAALNLKDLEYTIEPIHLVKNGGEQYSKKFTDINPMQQVPALLSNGITIIESMSILEYLEEAYPEIPLFPSDLVGRAKVREICGIIYSGIQPLQNPAVVNQLEEQKRSQWQKHFIMRGFQALEQILNLSSGKYCVGDTITLADCYLVPQVYNARRFNVDLIPYPTIVRIDKQLNDHPAFKASHPENQPDCPSNSIK